MYQVVLDTNVLEAALRSRNGASWRLLHALGSSQWRPNLTVAVLLEYEAVLKRDCAAFGLSHAWRVSYTSEERAMKNVQIPDDLYQRATELALRDQVSVDRLVTILVRERIGDWERAQSRAARGSLDRLHEVLSRVQDTPPDAGAYFLSTTHEQDQAAYYYPLQIK